MWKIPELSAEEILLYSRKSRADDPLLTVEEVLANHEQMLDEWMERNLPNAGRIPEENRYREVVSGETLSGRPKVQELLRRIESPKYKAVLIVEPQRLSRGDLEDIGRLTKILRHTNTLVFTLQYSYDLRDDHDRESFERELKRGNDFLEYQKRIMWNGRVLAAENGWFVGNRPPYGYDRITVREGKKDCHTLTPNPDQAPIVKLIFEMYAEGKGHRSIAKALTEMGVPAQRQKEWSSASIKAIRDNPHYLGKVAWNRRHTVVTVEDGEIKVTRPVNRDFLIFPGRHEALISQELWDAAHVTKGTIPKVKVLNKSINPLAGFMYCQCGRRMMGKIYHNSPPRLLCNNQPVCKTPSCALSEVMEAVVQTLKDAIEDFEIRVGGGEAEKVEQHAQLITRLEKRLKELDKQELAQWDKYTMDGMPKHIFDQLNGKTLQEKDEVKQALCVARDTMPEPIDYEAKKKLFSDALALLQDPEADVEAQNMLLRQCIDRIDYNRQRKSESNKGPQAAPPIELDIHLRV